MHANHIISVTMVAANLLVMNVGVHAQRYELVNRDDGKLVIRNLACSTGVLTGYSIRSNNGVLVPLDSASPLTFLLANTPENLFSASIPGYDIEFESELVLDAEGAGGWDVSRADEYDATLATQVSGFLGLYSWVSQGFCGTQRRIVDIGQITAGDDVGTVFTDVGGLDVVSGFQTNVSRNLEIDTFRIEGDDFGVFEVLGFEPLSTMFEGQRSSMLSIRVSDVAPTGVHEATLVSTGREVVRSLDNAVRVAPFEHESFELRVAIVPPDGDCNLDGAIDTLDLTCVDNAPLRDVVLDALNTLPGDLDGNGNVDFEDFLILSGNFNRAPAAYIEGDIDLSGSVDFGDFLTMSGNFNGSREGIISVPEANPMGVVALFVCGVLASCHRPNNRGEKMIGRDCDNTKRTSSEFVS